MSNSAERFQQLAAARSLHPRRDKTLRRVDAVALICGLLAFIVQRGLRHATGIVQIELGLLVIVIAAYLAVSMGLQFRSSLARRTFLRTRRLNLIVCTAWGIGMIGVLIFAPVLAEPGQPLHRFDLFVAVSSISVLLQGVVDLVGLIRRATAGASDPAVILVASFAILISVGTGLLMLPRARVEPLPAKFEKDNPFVVALFTATSASCVTGLIVVPTNEYWSPFGQTIILGLFQIGGLGIMTCGAFFAVAAGRHMQVRESATLRDMLESEQLGDVRRLVMTILAFTLLSELIGAIVISGLWSDLPPGEQVRYSVFHAVSAFCNAGFSLTDDSFVGLETRWQVFTGVCGLIIVGGMGFSVLYNLALWARAKFGRLDRSPLFQLPRERIRLSLTTKLAGMTTLLLLLIGAIGYYVLESTAESPTEAEIRLAETATGKRAAGEVLTEAEEEALGKVRRHRRGVGTRIANAWFQSVTFRTAGFNTVNHVSLQPATKLLAVLLMFIGASPGSTGGGVKTVCFAIAVLSMLSILRGRNRVEIDGRTIPPDVVNRSLAIISLGLLVVMITTIFLVLFEPDAESRFLDYLFEATSAFATVGVSADVTFSLSTPSRLVIAATMFIGRVGPLTLLIALAGRHRDARYEYPHERVTLG